MVAAALPSPNFGPRREGARPSLIVLHYTAMASCAQARARLCDPKAEVSAHYLIGEGGQVEALVDEAMRAWHAGAGAWGPISDVNSHSIGIELANSGDAPFPEPQMAALEALLAAIMQRWAIGPEAVIAHSDMAPARKCDPGPRFDWRRLALGGLAVWPQAAGDGTADFAASAHAIGYRAAAPDAVRAAFRLRFRPWAEGPEDAVDRALADDLARRCAGAP
ncbi:MAG: N-acetylmuramoyl-L-alanine amidase [Albidovulum sp.]